jgi:hypothetical protein
MSDQNLGWAGTVTRNLPAFTVFLLAGVLLALGIRAALSPEASSASHDHGAMPPVQRPPAPPPVARGPLIDLGNEVCPIMKKPVDGRTHSVWNGLRIGHCCAPCARDLLADPERLLDEAGIEWREAAAAMRRYYDAGEAARPAVLEEIASRFNLVTEE